jgi:hypothetical protein
MTRLCKKKKTPKRPKMTKNEWMIDENRKLIDTRKKRGGNCIVNVEKSRGMDEK